MKHGKGEARKMGQAPKENERTGKTRQPAPAGSRAHSWRGMAGRPECGRRANRQQGRQTSGNSERMPGMGPGMEASGKIRAAYLPAEHGPPGGRRRANRRKDGRPQATAERIPGMGPGMKARAAESASCLHSTGRPECGTREQLKAPTDLEIMEALKAGGKRRNVPQS